MMKNKSPKYPHSVKKERLSGTNIELTNFFFRYGANIYVLTYEKNGELKHTFIDTGYASHAKLIFPVLEEHQVNLKNIEHIIITHRHPDHSGLAGTLADISGATILAHANFKDFVEGNISEAEKRWLGEFDPTLLKKSRIEYLNPSRGTGTIEISGMDFPHSGKTIEMENGARLEILLIPESDLTHSPDQLIALYSPRKTPYTSRILAENNGFKPTDEMIFSGDLWLMRGPIYERSLRSLPLALKFFYFRLVDLFSGKTQKYPLPSEQDAKTKDALKQGFSLVQVKPGHGEDFLGSNLIPKSLLAERDLLIKLGFGMDDDKSLLQSSTYATRINELRNNAYLDFTDTLNLWLDMGYGFDEISGLLARIYMEQTGGGKLVEEDRRERRKLLKKTLTRLATESGESDILHRIASAALSLLSKPSLA